jgi:hypothetical protein
MVLGFELRAYTLSYSTSPLLWWVLVEIGSPELFAWVGFGEPLVPGLPTSFYTPQKSF